VPAEASRKLSITDLKVPPTAQAGDTVGISGAVRNAGDEQARVTVRPYLLRTVGQRRLGGRKLTLGAGRTLEFTLSPKISSDTPADDYEIEVCVERLNKQGPVRCRSAPLTIEG
jgi:hypothetical protein